VAVDALVKYLVNGGIPNDAIEFGSVSAYPQEEFVNGASTGRITSYRASRSVTVRSENVDLVRKLSTNLGSLLETGVNVSNYGPQFYVSKLSELLKQAMEDAKIRAEAIVSATGGSVGNVMSVRSGPFQVTSPDSVDTSSGGFYDTQTIDKTITSTVTVMFKVN
ncbi:MAG: SIMPL domain-containing protein, partial [Candidatus Nanopelagicaceae bacterium]